MAIRIGVIGAGSFGECHVASWKRMPDVEVAAVADLDGVRARQVAKRHEVPRSFETFGEMLASCQLDAVSICTPENAHLEPTVMALRLGVAALVEKPLATASVDARRIEENANETGTLLMPGHVLRFAPLYQELYRAVSQGRVGATVAISAVRDRTTDTLTAHGSTHPAFVTMIHDIDLALWMSGSTIESVRALARNPHALRNPAMVWATMEFSNGVVADLRTSFLRSDLSASAIDDRFDVYGSSGVASVNLSHPAVNWAGTTAHAPDIYIAPQGGSGALDAEIAHFCRLIAGTETPLLTVSDGVKAVQVAEAVVRSANANGALVQLDVDG